MADPLRHRQTKGAATDMVDLTPPRHVPTLHPLRSGLWAWAMTAVGHEDAFLRPRLSVRYRFSQGTFARTRSDGRDARPSTCG